MSHGNEDEIKQVLAMTIEMHFERKFSRDVILHELDANSMDVLKTMRNLWIRSSSSGSIIGNNLGISSSWFSIDSDLVLAIRIHFGDHFDSHKIVRELEDHRGDVLVTMRVLRDELEEPRNHLQTAGQSVDHKSTVMNPKL